MGDAKNKEGPDRPGPFGLLLHAAPFAIPLIFPPLILVSVLVNGRSAAAIAIFAFLAIPLIDALTRHNTRNLDPTLGDDRLLWHRLVTWAWVPSQLGLIAAMLFFADGRPASEALVIAASLGVVSGGIGITYAHELIHQRNRLEPAMGEILLCSTLYGHFRIEHVFGHHIKVATPEDPATARKNEWFPHFWGRTIAQQFASAWRIESHRLSRRGESMWSIRNAFWRYAAWTAFWITLAHSFAGGFGVILFLTHAVVAITLLEMVNYVEHYGLKREKRAGGGYEPVQPWHSWNANHRFSNFILINLQRHSDHHHRADRRFPLLQAHGEDKAPQLPLSYPAMVLLTLAPPLFFRVMNPRLKEWEQRFYPQRAAARKRPID